MFDNNILLITGGTGSFGNAILRRFIDSNIKEVRIFSRDEKKQDDMRKRFKSEKLKFYIGDVRDKRAVDECVRGANFIFHAAALKQVPSCEFFPMEAVKTNILGTENVLDAAIDSGVSRVVVLSTDKAVYPINAMGISKAMMEKVAVAKSRNVKDTVINVTRYGNVMCSRGSVIPLFVQQLATQSRISVTDPSMTRFMMSLDDAVNLVMYAFSHGKPGELFVQKAPAATVATLAKAIAELLEVSSFEIDEIGIRHGEKLFEALVSREEMTIAKDLGEYYVIPPDLRDLNYEKYMEKGSTLKAAATEYTSNNTHQLGIDGMRLMLSKLKYIQSAQRGEFLDSEE